MAFQSGNSTTLFFLAELLRLACGSHSKLGPKNVFKLKRSPIPTLRGIQTRKLLQKSLCPALRLTQILADPSVSASKRAAAASFAGIPRRAITERKDGAMTFDWTAVAVIAGFVGVLVQMQSWEKRLAKQLHALSDPAVVVNRRQVAFDAARENLVKGWEPIRNPYLEANLSAAEIDAHQGRTVQIVALMRDYGLFAKGVDWGRVKESGPPPSARDSVA
jgi:hypothetical protein